MGVSPKWVKSKRRKRKKKKKRKKRPKVGDNNGQATHGARKHEWRTQAAWAKSIKQDQDENFDPKKHQARSRREFGP